MENDDKDSKRLSNEEMRERLIRLVFDGDALRLGEFCRIVESHLPAGTSVVLRGSSVTGERWEDGAPFDADGPGTSDLDLTLVGDEVISLYNVEGFYVPLI